MKKIVLLFLLVAFGCQRGLNYRQAMISDLYVPGHLFVLRELSSQRAGSCVCFQTL